MKNRGFTLIELLGVIIILSLIMLIAIPNITSTLDRSKREQYLVDARKFVSLVEYKMRKGEYDKPSSTELFKFSLGYLETNDLENDADGNKYDLNNSYVVVARKEGTLVYYVTLVVKNGSTYKGIGLVNSEDLDSDVISDTNSNKSKYSLITNDVPQNLTDEQIIEKVGIVGSDITLRTIE